MTGAKAAAHFLANCFTCNSSVTHFTGNTAGSYFVSGDRRENVLLTLDASKT